MSKTKTFLFTSESVGAGHPDKICDQISDTILDHLLAQDSSSKVAIEAICKSDTVILVGEITTKATINYEEVVRGVIRDVGYDFNDVFDYRTVKVVTYINEQSSDIAQAISDMQEYNCDMVGKKENDCGKVKDEENEEVGKENHYNEIENVSKSVDGLKVSKNEIENVSKSVDGLKLSKNEIEKAVESVNGLKLSKNKKGNNKIINQYSSNDLILEINNKIALEKEIIRNSIVIWLINDINDKEYKEYENNMANFPCVGVFGNYRYDLAYKKRFADLLSTEKTTDILNCIEGKFKEPYTQSIDKLIEYASFARINLSRSINKDSHNRIMCVNCYIKPIRLNNAEKSSSELIYDDEIECKIGYKMTDKDIILLDQKRRRYIEMRENAEKNYNKSEHTNKSNRWQRTPLPKTNINLNEDEIFSNEAIDEVVNKWFMDYPELNHLVNEIYHELNSKQTNDSNKEDDNIGAGDQGMMFGYATDETDEKMPLTLILSHRIVRKIKELRNENPWLRPDCKSQVTVEYSNENGRLVPLKVNSIVVSVQHSEEVSTEFIREFIMKNVIKKVVKNNLLEGTKFFIQPSGRFIIGGPTGDAGLTGRKIIVDTYGGFGTHGGGCFSGKDCSKVDRSGAYAARWIAKSLICANICKRVLVQISYAIGIAEPLSINVDTYGTGIYADDKILEIIRSNFDLRPGVIIRKLGLKHPVFRDTAVYGHFGRSEFSWECPKRLVIEDINDDN